MSMFSAAEIRVVSRRACNAPLQAPPRRRRAPACGRAYAPPPTGCRNAARRAGVCAHWAHPAGRVRGVLGGLQPPASCGRGRGESSPGAQRPLHAQRMEHMGRARCARGRGQRWRAAGRWRQPHAGDSCRMQAPTMRRGRATPPLRPPTLFSPAGAAACDQGAACGAPQEPLPDHALAQRRAAHALSGGAAPLLGVPRRARHTDNCRPPAVPPTHSRPAACPRRH